LFFGLCGAAHNRGQKPNREPTADRRTGKPDNILHFFISIKTNGLNELICPSAKQAEATFFGKKRMGF
jgi:hypothetical protein